MKGVIPDCLEKLVKSKFGKDKWEDSLEAAGLPRHSSFLATADIPDADVMKVVESVCKVLNITLQQSADAFGDFWVNDYAPKIYKVYYRQSNSAKEFLLNMDNIHKTVTKNIPNAHPPRFTYNWKNDKTLVMTYKSSRGLIDFLVGLIKGVGKYYKEDLKVMKLGNDKVQIIF
ncbi:MAG: heme NO-binding domain-containing protein [Thermodesulfobacteriota bacterium]|nr:heme NO-binding domain-containing protein [Thermodesulfobacteriota bacterium]